MWGSGTGLLLVAGAFGMSCASAGEGGGRSVEPPETAASVWSLTESPAAGVCGMRARSLVVTAIKLGGGWAYIQASHSTEDTGESDPHQTPVTAQFVANGKTTDVASATGMATPGKGRWVAVRVLAA